eukprot:CAMPEP_0204643584 /NCGR_PEP_ID=MMETSP0718-20130828/825_1 /ASSEMBLY_ACC=CAM_ASM_000674 /TAXON_ID=230516 /ORGANISM="Chaetoceros curvisetus" /LENGTH=369 /DNA_ID=CAMNT_0051664865 /DNA_START=243 /DNA_END=1349 /DNA_ORIENTATION=-
MEVSNLNSLNPALKYLAEAWTDGCEEYFYYDDDTLRQKCSGNNGVYRVAFSALVFFVLGAVAAACKPTANREAWPAKYVLFLFLVAGTVFIPNEPLFSPIMLNIFRVGGVIFIIFNQLIILDMAFNINESCVYKADQADLDEGEGAGRKWLIALLLSSAVMYISSFVAIGFMYKFFTGCQSNAAFITITLVVGVLSTALQLTGEESSVFTSGCVFAYSTYLLYTAVSKNPEGECNPQLGEENALGIALGVGVTLIGVIWTGYSQTAHKAVGEESDAIADDADNMDPARRTEEGVGGVVVNENNTHDEDENGEENVKTFSNSWKLNIILSVITCWYAMSLTSWGSIANGGTLANPSMGRTSMWMVIASQW